MINDIITWTIFLKIFLNSRFLTNNGVKFSFEKNMFYTCSILIILNQFIYIKSVSELFSKQKRQMRCMKISTNQLETQNQDFITTLCRHYAVYMTFQYIYFLIISYYTIAIVLQASNSHCTYHVIVICHGEYILEIRKIWRSNSVVSSSF